MTTLLIIDCTVMPEQRPRSPGEIITLIFVLLNLVFVVIVHISQVYCQSEADGYSNMSSVDQADSDEGQCEDLFFFTQENHGTAVGHKDFDHHAGRTALALTTLSGGVYVVQLIRQFIRIYKNTLRDYVGRIEVAVETVLVFMLSLVSWILILQEGKHLNKIEDAGGTREYSPSVGWVLLLLIWLMNLFIAVRSTTLVFKPESWPEKVGGSFGTGNSARVAEQFPVMGGQV